VVRVTMLSRTRSFLGLGRRNINGRLFRCVTSPKESGESALAARLRPGSALTPLWPAATYGGNGG